MKIEKHFTLVGCTWFTEYGGNLIGVVMVYDQIGKCRKAWIGTGVPGNEKVEDMAHIIMRGAKIPVHVAHEIIKDTGEVLSKLFYADPEKVINDPETFEALNKRPE